MHSALTEQVAAIIEAAARELSTEVVEVSFKKRRDTTVIDVIADKPSGGITIDECARLNKGIVKELEETRLLGDHFVVEVASPGLDRALKTAQDFNRNRGRMVRFHLKEPVNSKVEHQGEVIEVADDHVTIISKQETITIRLETISKAVQVI